MMLRLGGIGVFLKSIAITIGIMWLFYRSLWGGIWYPFILWGVIQQTKKEREMLAKKRLQEEFLHGIGVLNSALQAGLSMENAWKEVEKEVRGLFGEDAVFYLELKEMNRKVAHNTPIEKLFLEFAYRSKLEDMIQFAELLEFGKRSGSNWKKIIDVTAAQMTEQQEAKQEIEVMMAEKKMEQNVMNIMPLGLLAFLQLSAWDYMSVLYHNWFGVICMTFFLIAYMGAIALSKKIQRVEV